MTLVHVGPRIVGCVICYLVGCVTNYDHIAKVPLQKDMFLYGNKPRGDSITVDVPESGRLGYLIAKMLFRNMLFLFLREFGDTLAKFRLRALDQKPVQSIARR